MAPVPETSLKRALITGASGTVGRPLVRALRSRGVETIAWDRAQVAVDDYWGMDRIVEEIAPTHLFHLAVASELTGAENESQTVNVHWPHELSWIARQRSVTFIHTSSASVFSMESPGPYTAESVPDAREGVGYEKLASETVVRQQNPEARIVRLGWQIGDAPDTSNSPEAKGHAHMLNHLEALQRRDGRVEASTQWLPACAHVEDTAAALIRAAESEPGTYAVDSNREWSFFAIATALSKAHDNRWSIEATRDPAADQRMLDNRLQVPALSERWPGLP